MMDTCNLSKLRSLTRARQIVLGITLFLGITLGGPPRLWGNCDPNAPPVTSFTLSVSPGSIVGGSTTVGTMTITLGSPPPGTTMIGINSPAGLLHFSPQLYYDAAVLVCGQTSVTYNFTVSGVSQVTSATITASGVGPQATSGWRRASRYPHQAGAG